MQAFAFFQAAIESAELFYASPAEDSDFDRPSKLGLHQALLQCQQLLQLLLALRSMDDQIFNRYILLLYARALMQDTAAFGRDARHSQWPVQLPQQ